MKNDYGILDAITTVPFALPPIPTGEYIVPDAYGTNQKYHFRRMPRANKYTGRYGLFYHDPDAHWILVAFVNDAGEFQRPFELPREWEPRLSLFLTGKRELRVRRCCWCGRVIAEATEATIHQTATCKGKLP